MRNLSCRFCLQVVAALKELGARDKLAEYQVDLVGVSLGTVEQGKVWKEKTGFEGELYVDESTEGNPKLALSAEGSRAYGKLRLVRTTTSPKDDERTKAILAQGGPDMMELTRKDSQGEITIWPGDVFQMGGAFVLGPGNACDFAHRSEYAGHEPDLAELIAAATGVDSRGVEVVYQSTKDWLDRLDSLAHHGTHEDLDEEGHEEGQLQEMIYSLKKALAGLDYGLIFVVTGIFATAWYFAMPVAYAGSYIAIITIAAVSYAKVAQKRNNNVAGINLEDVHMLTPIDIDTRILEAGLAECDCGGVMQNIPMFSLSEQDVSSPTSTLHDKATLRGSVDLDGPIMPTEDAVEYQTSLCYFREFLAKPHPAVGRPGPVCPFVPMSLKRNIIYLSVVRTSALTQQSTLNRADRAEAVCKVLQELLKAFCPKFEALHPSTGKLRQYKAAVFIFPDVKTKEAHDIIDKAQVAVKELFVARGLMVGEFHRANNASGLRNPDFYPLRTPYPCLAVRHMVPGDFVFMTLDNYAKPLQRQFLTNFLDVFGKEQDKKEVVEAKERLRQLEAEQEETKKE